MRFRDIKKINTAKYRIQVSWGYLERFLQGEIEEIGLDINPDFQRAHVWNREQQIKYVEHVLREGQSSREIYLNCPGWMDDWRGPYVIVDGKQRLEAARAFLRDDVPAFGAYYSEFEDKLPLHIGFSWNINNLDTRKEVLEWYLALNDGGVVHTQDELDKVRKLLEEGR